MTQKSRYALAPTPRKRSNATIDIACATLFGGIAASGMPYAVSHSSTREYCAALAFTGQSAVLAMGTHLVWDGSWPAALAAGASLFALGTAALHHARLSCRPEIAEHEIDDAQIRPIMELEQDHPIWTEALDLAQEQIRNDHPFLQHLGFAQPEDFVIRELLRDVGGIHDLSDYGDGAQARFTRDLDELTTFISAGESPALHNVVHELRHACHFQAMHRAISPAIFHRVIESEHTIRTALRFDEDDETTLTMIRTYLQNPQAPITRALRFRATSLLWDATPVHTLEAIASRYDFANASSGANKVMAGMRRFLGPLMYWVAAPMMHVSGRAKVNTDFHASGGYDNYGHYRRALKRGLFDHALGEAKTTQRGIDW